MPILIPGTLYIYYLYGIIIIYIYYDVTGCFCIWTRSDRMQILHAERQYKYGASFQHCVKPRISE